MSAQDKLIPIIVASPLFLQNLDTSVMATALPSIAQSLGVEPLHLNLAITSYLLSLAIFLPMSGWAAERFGAKRVFCFAIASFSLGSALCGLATSLESLVAFRILQGMGGAMMVPVGRLILLRNVQPAAMIGAMVLYTVPPAIGRLAGPLFGGVIVTFTSWRWIFLVNVPFGLLFVTLALLFIDDAVEEQAPQPFDTAGLVLLAIGLVTLLGSLESVGKGFITPWVTCAAAAIGVVALCAYYLRSSHQANPILNLKVLRFKSYYTSIIGGAPLRVAIGASPFLLPLMLQLGFGLSALNSGLLTCAAALGALATRPVAAKAMRLIGFRSMLIGTTALTGLCYMSYALFTPATSHVLMFCAMLMGGLVNAMGLVTLQTLGFHEIPKPLMSHGATLATMAQQLSVSLGVVLGASLVSTAAWWHNSDSAHPAARDFSPAFVFIGMMTFISLAFFFRLRKDEGAEMR